MLSISTVVGRRKVSYRGPHLVWSGVGPRSSWRLLASGVAEALACSFDARCPVLCCSHASTGVTDRACGRQDLQLSPLSRRCGGAVARRDRPSTSADRASIFVDTERQIKARPPDSNHLDAVRLCLARVHILTPCCMPTGGSQWRVCVAAVATIAAVVGRAVAAAGDWQ